VAEKSAGNVFRVLLQCANVYALKTHKKRMYLRLQSCNCLRAWFLHFPAKVKIVVP